MSDKLLDTKTFWKEAHKIILPELINHFSKFKYTDEDEKTKTVT